MNSSLAKTLESENQSNASFGSGRATRLLGVAVPPCPNLKSMTIFRFEYERYDASRLNLKLMTILASGSQSNAVFGSGFEALRCLPDQI